MTNNTSAVAPWLGYTTQEYRLVQRLLNAKKGNVLGFEILDDVQEQSDQRTVLEQDKISVTSRNIISNQSKDLWKTLSNWCDLILSDKVEPTKTEFLLYTNKEHSSDAIKLLVGAGDLTQAKEAFKELEKLVDSPSESIKKYVDNFCSFDERKYILIENFSYLSGSGSASTDLMNTYLDANTSIEEHAESIIHEILGWTKDTLTLLAEQKLPTLIEAKSFGRRLGEIESKYRHQSLLDFICKRAADDLDVQSELIEQPIYLQQLQLVNLDDTEIEEAVIAKLESKDAVTKWALEGRVQEASYAKYSDALKRKWKLQKTITFIEHSNKSEALQGELLYNQCLLGSTGVQLENKPVDDFFSHGSFQSLANTKDVGWHPNYIEKLRGGKK
ncbi:hypothetical protein L1D59_03505 [Pseudoalteromonas piscicida]|uniref:ABC-three component system protein n=1 Tax=Pseudoalteromonas piscicida TaxID=43662 RepID=UPI001EFCB238|nr:ABC-three component system protein [Pseudoalteromonas piscicida]MCG9767666.1 hypothetical protein [Pseudoalteromonas piscicida]